jgi:hypothetical protein
MMLRALALGDTEGGMISRLIAVFSMICGGSGTLIALLLV